MVKAQGCSVPKQGEVEIENPSVIMSASLENKR